MQSIDLYKYLLEHMSVKITNGQKTTNKAIMLLSVIDLIRCGYITDNKIYIEDTIQEAFEYNWRKYVNPIPPTCWTPFWHMKKEDFWHFALAANIQTVDEIVPANETASVGKMRSCIMYAYIDEEFYELLQDSVYRNIYRQLLLDTYVR